MKLSERLAARFNRFRIGSWVFEQEVSELKNVERKLQLATHVCQIVLLNNYVNFTAGEDHPEDHGVRFINNVLGNALRHWWIAEYDGVDKAMLVCSYCKKDDCKGCQCTVSELFEWMDQEKVVKHKAALWDKVTDLFSKCEVVSTPPHESRSGYHVFKASEKIVFEDSFEKALDKILVSK